MKNSQRVAEGDKVVMRGQSMAGTLVQIDRHLAVVDFEGLEVKIPLNFLEKYGLYDTQVPFVTKKKKQVNVVLDIDSFTSFSSEIDLHGMSVYEALTSVSKWLDEALLAGHKRIKVIHGKGTGTLRRAVREYLSTHEHVSCILGHHPYLGGEGVTWLELS